MNTTSSFEISSETLEKSFKEYGESDEAQSELFHPGCRYDYHK